MSRRIKIGREVESLRHRGPVLLIVSLLIVVLFFVIGYIVLPSPPDTFVVSTGGQGGAYAVFGERYRKILARESVRVQVLSSSGSVENLRRLSDNTVQVDAGFVQEGTGSSAEARNLVSLGAICYSPLWIFYRGSEILDDPSKLKGRRIAIGPEGSGVRKLAQEVLRAGHAVDPPTELLDLQSSAANKALLQGAVDAVMITGTEDNSLVRELLYTPSIKLMSFRQAEAYARLFPALSHVVLPAGILDLSQKFPSEDVHLLAVTTSLIVRKDLHPALIYLMLDALVEAHGAAGWVNRRGEFPSLKELDFPLSKYAERFYKSGRPFLLDYLPFRYAALVDRLVVVLVPLAFLFAPVLYVVSSLYAWRNRRKVYRWYWELKDIEREMAPTGPEQTEMLKQRLDRIEASINKIRVPLGYIPNVYRLKEHVDLIRGRLARLSSAISPQPTSGKGPGKE